MKAHKTSGYGRKMDKVISGFQEGDSYTNRRGKYRVTSINCKLMTVIYEGDSTETVLDIETQRQIILSMVDDAAVDVDASTWDTRTPKKDPLIDRLSKRSPR